jgi:Na+/H+ antiporter
MLVDSVEHFEFMSVLEVILIALAVVSVLAVIAQRLGIPYPLLLVLGGIGLGLVPELPPLNLQPDLIFLLFVPPLVLSAAWRSSWEDLRADLHPIVSLAIGLVIATMIVVAVVARWLIPGMTWQSAFVLGAIVSATDTTAVTAIAERMHLPRRIVSILEGESLGNDATSLVAYRMAVAAVVTGTFSLGSAVVEFLFAAVAGIALGLATAYLYTWFQRHLHNPSVEVTITLLLPFVAYIPANYIGASGVLAVVAAGLYAGEREPAIRSAGTRLQARAVWDTLVFVLNGLIFILLGLQLPIVLDGVSHHPAWLLVQDAAIVIATVVLIRIFWTVGFMRLLSVLQKAAQLPTEPWLMEAAPVIAWAGMRGADTLVIALAVPLVTSAGTPFPDRTMIIFLTFCVIVVTLISQGLSLPGLVRRTGLEREDIEREVASVRAAAHSAAVRRIDELARDRTLPDAAARLRSEHERLAQIFAAQAEGTLDQAFAKRAESLRQLRQDLVDTERREIINMHNRGEISDAALRIVLYDLDLEEEKGE